jgi:hypothetical protein
MAAEQIAAQKRSACLAVHPSNLLSLLLNASLATFQQASYIQSSQKNLENTFFPNYTTFHILGGSPPPDGIF